MTVISVESRTLVCKLSPAERLDRGAAMASSSVRAEELKAQRSELGREISDLVRERIALGEALHRGIETRPVECEWRADYRAGTKALVRLDTGETIETAALSRNERQASMSVLTGPGDEGDAGGDEGDPDEDEAAAVPLSPANAPPPAKRRGRRASPPPPPPAALGPSAPAMPVHHEYGAA